MGVSKYTFPVEFQSVLQILQHWNWKNLSHNIRYKERRLRYEFKLKGLNDFIFVHFITRRTKFKISLRILILSRAYRYMKMLRDGDFSPGKSWRTSFAYHSLSHDILHLSKWKVFCHPPIFCKVLGKFSPNKLYVSTRVTHVLLSQLCEKDVEQRTFF